MKAHFMPGIAVDFWKVAARRAYPNTRPSVARRTGVLVTQFPMPRKFSGPHTPIAAHYYKMLDRVNLGFYP